MKLKFCHREYFYWFVFHCESQFFSVYSIFVFEIGILTLAQKAGSQNSGVTCFSNFRYFDRALGRRVISEREREDGGGVGKKRIG